MRIEFSEFVPRPVELVSGFFKTPADWVRLYGLVGEVKNRGDGWYAGPLKRFPVPLVARITTLEPSRLVRWQLGGFWRGTGEVRFVLKPGGVQVEGYEELGARWLPGFSRILERLFMEREFQRTWSLGWSRLRSGKAASTLSDS